MNFNKTHGPDGVHPVGLKTCSQSKYHNSLNCFFSSYHFIFVHLISLCHKMMNSSRSITKSYRPSVCSFFKYSNLSLSGRLVKKIYFPNHFITSMASVSSTHLETILFSPIHLDMSFSIRRIFCCCKTYWKYKFSNFSHSASIFISDFLYSLTIVAIDNQWVSFKSIY